MTRVDSETEFCVRLRNLKGRWSALVLGRAHSSANLDNIYLGDRTTKTKERSTAHLNIECGLEDSERLGRGKEAPNNLKEESLH